MRTVTLPPPTLAASADADRFAALGEPQVTRFDIAALPSARPPA
jgi:hypothetical protein